MKPRVALADVLEGPGGQPGASVPGVGVAMRLPTGDSGATRRGVGTDQPGHEVVRTLYYARDYNRALEQAQKALQLNPEYYRIHFWMARVYDQKGMYAEAVAESQKVLRAMPDSTLGLTELAYSLAAGGHQAEARKILQHLEEKSKQDFVPAYNFAVIHAALHENSTALQYLQRAYEERDWALMVVAVEPRLDPLRAAPDFQQLMAKVRPSS